MFLPEVKNIFVSRKQLLHPKHMFPSLATMETMLFSFQCRSLIKKFFQSKDGSPSAANYVTFPAMDYPASRGLFDIPRKDGKRKRPLPTAWTFPVEHALTKM